MDELVIDHNYRLGIAWDKTKYRNHGILHETPPGTGYFAGSLSFSPGRSHPGSAVVVPPAKSLERIRGFRVRAVIRTTPLGGGGRRQNIVEGERSFAFFINPNLSLQGTFLSANGTWDGIATGPMAVPPNQTLEVEYSYDGISAAEILVNGTRVATSYDPTYLVGPRMIGPVRGVGPWGVVIGHWPAQDDRYTFHGNIWSVAVWKRDEIKDLLSSLNPCCLRDLTDIYEAGEKLRKKGYNLEYARGLLDKLIEMGSELAASTRGDSEAETADLNFVVKQFMTAVRSGGSTPLGPALRQAAELIANRTTPEDLDDLGKKATQLLDELPLKPEEILDLGRKFCFGKVHSEVKRTVEEMDKDPEWNATRRKFQARRRR